MLMIVTFAAPLAACGTAEAHPPDCEGNHWNQLEKDLSADGFSCAIKDRGIDSGTLRWTKIQWNSQIVCPSGLVVIERYEIYFNHYRSGNNWETKSHTKRCE